MVDPTHFSLFTGIGGIDIASEWAGFKTVGQVEKADYQFKVLEKHWPDVPKWRDVKDVTVGSVRKAGIECEITLVSGGFPCQPFSCAGKRRGKEDDRHLWPEMFRVIKELRPAWVLGENVAGFVNMELNNYITDLEDQGYSVRAFLIPACGVEALHKRERCFIIAHRDLAEPLGGMERGRALVEAVAGIPKPGGNCKVPGVVRVEDVADANGQRLQRYWGLCKCQGEPSSWQGSENVPNTQRGHASQQREVGRMGRPGKPVSWDTRRPWEFEPAVGRVVDGLPSRVDRLKGLGNAVVPQQVYPILKAIADIEKMGLKQPV